MKRRHRRCCVNGCIGNKISKKTHKNSVGEFRDISFYRIPIVIKNQGEKCEELSLFRRQQWIIRLRLSDELVSDGNSRVCSRHFHSGAPANLYDTTNPDWVPSQSLEETPDDIPTVKRYQRRLRRSRQQQEFLTPKSTKRARKGFQNPQATSTPSTKPKSSMNSDDPSSSEPTIRDATSLEKYSTSVDEIYNNAIECNTESEETITSFLVETETDLSISHVQTETELSISHVQTETDLSISHVQTESAVSYLSVDTQTDLVITTVQTQTAVSYLSIGTQTDFLISNGQTETAVNKSVETQTNSVMSNIQTEPMIIEPKIQEDKCYENTFSQTIFRVSYTFELEAAENELKECKALMETLKSQLEESNDKIKSQIEQISELKLILKKKEEDIEKFKFMPTYFKDVDKVLFFTGLTSFEYLKDIAEEIKPYMFKNSKLNPFQQFILTVMKLRLAATNKDLSYRFNVSEAVIGRIFYNCLNALYNRLYRFVKWPERDELQATMPLCFREKFGTKCAVIIDCFEVFSNKPSSVKTRAETWSSYKHHNTVKFLIGVTPQGSISFISKGWGGRVSDKYLTEHSGILEKLVPGDLVLADRGFDIDDSVGFYCATIKYPTFVNGKKQLDPLDVEATRKLANVRIHVERVIGQLRQKYKILHTKIPTEFLRHAPNENVSTIDKICTVCCALTNLTPSVVPIE